MNGAGTFVSQTSGRVTVPFAKALWDFRLCHTVAVSRGRTMLLILDLECTGSPALFGRPNIARTEKAQSSLSTPNQAVHPTVKSLSNGGSTTVSSSACRHRW